MNEWRQNSTIVRTLSGPEVAIRELTRSDAGRAVDAVFAGLSPQSRYLRFHTPVRRLSGPLRRLLAEVDGVRRVALVAEVRAATGWAPIGIVRFADTGSGAAEIAVAVVDAWQGRGVGRRLLADAAALADRIGYRELTGRVLPENAVMRGLVRRAFPLARFRIDGDALMFTGPLGELAGTVTDADVLASLLSRSG